MDPITNAALAHFATLYPGYAIRLQSFLSGPARRGGFVPNDWNGQTIDVGYPWRMR